MTCPWTTCRHCGYEIRDVVGRSRRELEAEIAAHQKMCPAYWQWRSETLAKVRLSAAVREP